MKADHSIPKEGDLYKKLDVEGFTFELVYGYYDEHERPHSPPVVIFPDLETDELYTKDGYRLVTEVQDSCEYFSPAIEDEEGWCGDCMYYSGDHKEIGICRNEDLRQQNFFQEVKENVK